MSSPTEVVKQLNSARQIVLGDPAIYPQVVPGVLPVIGAGAHLDLRRWGADFLAETFASPVISPEQKQKMVVSSDVLGTLRSYLQRKEQVGEDEDTSVIKSAVQCAASVYPLVFRHTVTNASDGETWSKLAAIKSSILRRMDTAAPGVRICCVKFVAMVVLVQTAGLIADPRRPEQNEVSLALVPRDHAVLKFGMLEAEASGLLDRLLDIMQADGSDALLVTAMLNSLSSLVQRRASISNKILSAVLAYNPLRLASRAMSGRDKVALRSMTRTTMSFLLNVLKRNPQHTLAGRLQQHIERLRHSLIDVFSDTNDRKRSAPDEPTDGLDDRKRQRVEIETANGRSPLQQPPRPPPPTYLGPGPVSIAQLFSLENNAAANFDVQVIPPYVVAQLVPPLLQNIDQRKFDEAINVVKARFLNLGKPAPGTASDAARAVMGRDEDDYDPDAEFGGRAEQVNNRLDQMPPEGFGGQSVAIGPFNLPTPPPMNNAEIGEYSKTAVMRVFDTLTGLDREARQKGVKKTEVEKGFIRLAASNHDREGWITLVTRLATRASFDLQDGNGNVKQEGQDRAVVKKDGQFDLANSIRKSLLNYVMEAFRARIGIAISWLNEEWYADQLLKKQQQAEGIYNEEEGRQSNYEHWMLRFLDSIVPYIDIKDNKTLIRFLSEIPAVHQAVLERVKKLADDPERVNLVIQALVYLVMFRPPVRQMALDALEDLWRRNEDARKPAEKHLAKYRPDVVNAGVNGTAEMKAEG